MPDIQIRVSVVGKDQAIGDLKAVGSAAQSAGKTATAGSGGMLKFASSAAGAATGAMALTNGLFGMQDAFDQVADADLNVQKAHKKTELADRALKKAQEDVKKEFQDSTKVIRDNNGAVGTQTEHILSYNAATGEAIVQTKTANGEFKISTKNIKENSQAFKNLDIAQQGSTIAHENEAKAIREDNQVHERLGVTLAANTLQIGLGALAMVPFIQKLIQMVTGGKGAAEALKNVGNAASGAGSAACAQVDCTEKAAGAVGQLGSQAIRSAVPIRAFAAGVGIVGGGAGLMATNFLGARDAIGGTANAIQNADVNLKPLGLTIDGLMKQAKILPDPFNKANQEIGTGTEGISRQIMRMGQVGGQGISFITKGFEQFSTQIAAGNLGGAIDTAIGGITKGLDKLKNINFSSNATINWVIKNIWPALQTIYADLKATWGAVSVSYNATINWLATHVWPALVDAYAKLRQTWGNVVTAYNATINWLTTHVWPALADAYAKLRQTWGNVVTAYNATVNWLVVHVWPALVDAYAKLRQTWGNVVTAYNATVNWLVVHVWPTVQDAYAKLRQTWGNVVAAYNATVNWLVVHVWPALADAYAKLRQTWGNVVAAYNATINWLVVHNWPPLADAYAKLRQTWGNVVTAYNATVNWLVVHNWPPLADAYAKLRQTWGNVVAAYNATINWNIGYNWPTIADAETALGKVWGVVSFPYDAAIKITGKFEFPDIGKALTDWAATVKIPNLDTLWTSIKTAIKAPAPKVASAIWSALGLAAEGGTFIIPPEAMQKIQAFIRQYEAQQNASKAPTVGQLGGGTPTVTMTPGTTKNYNAVQARAAGLLPNFVASQPYAKPTVPAVSGPGGTSGLPTLSGLGSSNYVTIKNPYTNQYVLASQVGQSGFKGMKEGGNVIMYGAARGGSFIVDHPTTFGNLQVGEGRNPELLTLVPLSDGGGILNVTPLKGPNAPPALRGQSARGGGLFGASMGGDWGSLMKQARSAGGLGGHGGGGGGNFNYEKLMSVVQKLIMMWSSREQNNMNLFVDGQRMVTSVQKHLGSNSYGDR